MIEIPESNNLSMQLKDTLQNKTIQNVYTATSPHKFAWYHQDPEEYHRLLSGKIITDAYAVGGQVEICAEDMRIVLGDGVNIRYLEPGDTIPKKHQLYIEFEDLSAIVCTVQMYGGLLVFKDGEIDNPYYLVAKEKPSPLSAKFDSQYFKSIIEAAKPTLSVKALLATEQRIPGLGNGTLQDILFNAEINPKTKINQLTEEEIETLFICVKGTLMEMTTRGGRDTEKDLFGCYGGYKTILSKKTIKDPCPRCGSDIVKQAYLGGNVYYCTVCQIVKK